MAEVQQAGKLATVGDRAAPLIHSGRYAGFFYPYSVKNRNVQGSMSTLCMAALSSRQSLIHP
jgi:hypothetical protein